MQASNGLYPGGHQVSPWAGSPAGMLLNMLGTKASTNYAGITKHGADQHRRTAGPGNWPGVVPIHLHVNSATLRRQKG